MSGFVQPTTWNLSNTATSLQVSYSVAGPNLHYHQGAVVKDFTGNQIRVAEVPDVGTLVSVTIQMMVYSGSTTLTMLLPRVNDHGQRNNFAAQSQPTTRARPHSSEPLTLPPGTPPLRR